MTKLLAFNSVSLDGYFVDENGNMRWAYNTNTDEEWEAFVAGNASGGGILVFGRITYELMVSYWPTPLAMQNNPVVAEQMNKRRKIVFSRTLSNSLWNNTKIVKEGMVAEIRKMKNEAGNGIAILGSGSIISQLTQERLIDEYQVVVTPVILGKGRTMFEGIKGKLNLKLTRTRSFSNGNVVLCYEPIR